MPNKFYLSEDRKRILQGDGFYACVLPLLGGEFFAIPGNHEFVVDLELTREAFKKLSPQSKNKERFVVSIEQLKKVLGILSQGSGTYAVIETRQLPNKTKASGQMNVLCIFTADGVGMISETDGGEPFVFNPFDQE